jgi:hypothetical protein
LLLALLQMRGPGLSWHSGLIVSGSRHIRNTLCTLRQPNRLQLSWCKPSRASTRRAAADIHSRSVALLRHATVQLLQQTIEPACCKLLERLLHTYCACTPGLAALTEKATISCAM